MRRSTGRVLTAAVIAVIAVAAPVAGNPRSAALRSRAMVELHNLDRERAIASFREAIAADADDAAPYRGLAIALWMGETFRRGTMTVDSYLGSVTRSKMAPAPPEVVTEFNRSIDRAIAIARQRLAANAKDADAHYQLGAAIGIRASFSATIGGSLRAAFGSAREAYNAHEKVLELDPRRSDAGLVVGTYRYMVAALALPLRWAAYVAGIGGGRERGMRLVERAASYPGDNQTDARIALILLYNRERRFDDALRIINQLQTSYSRNRLLWLEAGATLLRANRPIEADRYLTEGIARLEADNRARMFGEDALWYGKRGTARAWVGRDADATHDLRKALSLEGRKWVHGRAHFELGRLALKAGNRAAAEKELRTAASLCEGDNDDYYAAEARRLLN
jgi:tetratricopeptide (TPR) repeat protein